MNFSPNSAWITLAGISAWSLPTLICSLNSLKARALEEAPSEPPFLSKASLVSILIPARNEAKNLVNTLPTVLEAASRLIQAGLRAEIILLDDSSSDDTFSISNQIAFAHESVRRGELEVRVLKSQSAPSDGWNGKTSACHHLSKVARGDLLLFLDADVNLGPLALLRSLSSMVESRGDALTALPYQIMIGPSERFLIPLIMHLSIFSFLPLPLVRSSTSASLSVLNGQFFLIRRHAYDGIGGHTSVKSSLLEDVELGRRLKKKGYHLEVVTAAHDIQVRMYDSQSAIWEGFGKNLAPLLGGSSARLAFLNAVFVGALLMVPYFSIALAPSELLHWIPLVLSGFCRILTGVLFRYKRPILEILKQPLQAVLFLVLAVHSIKLRKRNEIYWKGRRIPQS